MSDTTLPDPAKLHWRQRVHERLLDTIDLRRRDLGRMSDAELRHETAALIAEIVAADPAIPAAVDRDRLCREVLDEAIGLGPLEALLEDERISEIMVNRFDEIFVERDGRIERHPCSFTSDRAVLGVIERIVAPIGRRIDESSPMVDARLKDGSRVNAVIPPLALKGPTLTIRRFARRHLTMADMLERGTLSAAMAAFLRICVEERRNIVVSGGTGTGKTTFLNLLSGLIPEGERVITIEDAAELRLDHHNLVSLEARPSNLEGRGAVSIRELVRNALRMRPDRIVIGECRGPEALDMLQAMNTGHEGSLTTLHANSPRDALARLETLVLMAGMDLPLNAIREQIASAIDIIVQQTRFACGTRRVTSICEVTGLEGGRVQLQELFRFERAGQRGERFVGCDAVPNFYDELRQRQVALDFTIFDRLPA
ncbi:MAG: CpaF family protein [Thauera phenolivorans]|uniref:CpaF family protein n=1 Tax=Thauera phenolivorans TaxID=1792543 RepID=A0A7X7R7D1_9RHOO|nr:CpaF family protein [Thauera phenolivorans]NLF53652.1 CpaF family protein [Thauera phenolivorans]